MNRWHLRLAGLVTALTSTAYAAEPPRKIDFTRDIRPILSDACFLCHGPDPENRKADLRLDTKTGALGEGNVPGAFMPGKLDESEAWRRIISTDATERMPPPKSGKKLTDQQIELIRQWIAEGAKWSTHWAFEAPVRPAPPAVNEPGKVRNPIDAFVLSRLEREGLSFSPEADRATLIRRLSLDLTGLPPSIAEVDAFVNDRRPEAYADLVERLLNSPHYGERFARLWLDAARYADSDGFEKDKPRFTWAYRDWVIQALNRDLPYDRFIIEQIAGDLLPNAEQDQLVATGFLRNSMINEEGGIDPEQFRMEAMFDRMDAIGKGVLGLTIQCAQCHTHKYDPLTHEEYYKLFAFLNNSHEANIAVYTPEEQTTRAEIFRRIAEVEAELQERTPDWRARMAVWEQSVRNDQPEWSVLQTAEDDPSGDQKMYRMGDGSFLCQGYAPTKINVDLKLSSRMQNITAFRLEQLNDPNLPLGGPGRSIRGTGALTEFKVRVRPVGSEGKGEWVKFSAASADVNPPERELDPMFNDKSGKHRVTGPANFAIDGKDETAWGIDIGPGRRNVPRKAVFVLEKPIGFEEGIELEVHLVQNHGGWTPNDNQNHNLGRFRLSITTAEAPVADPLPAAVRQLLSVPATERTPAQTATVFSYWRTTVSEWSEANAQIDEIWRRHPEGSSQLVLNERDDLRMTHLLSRGDFLKPAAAVTPGVPAFLHPLPKDALPDRLTLARWLTDRNSPTTARSLVNRVWQAYFGTGIVGTSEDLGSQSEAPTHPELLDWLAVEFMEPSTDSPPLRKGGPGGVARAPNWSLKNLHRLIVTSATYRQSSKATPDLLARDPANRLLARGSRYRVDAEVVRDIALAASGLLDPTVGGPSVHPPAPAFLFEPPNSFGQKPWKEDVGSTRFRRALYTFRFRTVPYPMLQNFDAPNGDFSCVRRTRSNTPLQALTALNEPVFLECARALAQKTLREGGATSSERIVFAFRRCLTRSPTEKESLALTSLLERQMQRFTDATENPWTLAAADSDHPPELPAGVTPAQAAAWTVVARVLLNLDETITRE